MAQPNAVSLPLPMSAAAGDVATRAAERLAAEQEVAALIEAERQAAARQEAVKQASVQAEAARQDAIRQEAERQAAAQQLAARRDASRAEAARQDLARQDAERQEAARLEAARQAAARQESARQDAARQEAGRQEAARQDATQQAAAQQEAAELAQREARRRAIGRQLDEEAARRDAAAAAAASVLPSRLPPSASSLRRGRLFGRADPNVELLRYAEAWARKIQLNLTFDQVRELAKRPHSNPLVTVAIRSDGSVESVTLVVSSGVAELDEAVRRVVQSQAPYPAFSPALAGEFDVVEIRRSWHFDMAIRLY